MKIDDEAHTCCGAPRQLRYMKISGREQMYISLLLLLFFYIKFMNLAEDHSCKVLHILITEIF